MVKNRAEFIQWVIDNVPRGDALSDPDSVLWNPEKGYGKPIYMNWFVCVKPIAFDLRYFPDGRGNDKGIYWAWCNNVMQGDLRCFMSNDNRQQEWWGFTHEQDIPVWLLKWSQ